MIYVCQFPEAYLGADVIGEGALCAQCATMVQILAGAPLTEDWRKGAQVKGNCAIVKGTAIATFLQEGKDEYLKQSAYLYNNSAARHAAIFIGQDEKGIKMLDQWAGRDKIGFSLRSFGSKYGGIADGDNYYVIEGPPHFNGGGEADRGMVRV